MKYEEYVRLRNEKKLSDYQVSKDTGISRSTFTQWKKGVINPAPHTQARLHKYFEEYDVNSKLSMPQKINALSPAKFSITNATFGIRVSNYVIELPNGKNISLSSEEYERLQNDLSTFLLDWAKAYGKL